MSTFKILFLLKKGKGINKDSLPIYVRVTVAGKRVEWSTHRRCKTGISWDQRKGGAIGKKGKSRN